MLLLFRHRCLFGARALAVVLVVDGRRPAEHDARAQSGDLELQQLDFEPGVGELSTDRRERGPQLSHAGAIEGDLVAAQFVTSGQPGELRLQQLEFGLVELPISLGDRPLADQLGDFRDRSVVLRLLLDELLAGSLVVLLQFVDQGPARALLENQRRDLGPHLLPELDLGGELGFGVGYSAPQRRDEVPLLGEFVAPAVQILRGGMDQPVRRLVHPSQLRLLPQRHLQQIPHLDVRELAGQVVLGQVALAVARRGLVHDPLGRWRPPPAV